MAEKKVKWKPSNQEYCFIKQTDDKPNKLVVGTFGDTNVVTEFDVGGSATAGVNSLNTLQGNVYIDAGGGITVDTLTDGNRIHLGIEPDTYQPINNIIMLSSYGAVLNYDWSMPEGNYTNWEVYYSETNEYLVSPTTSSIEFANSIARYIGPDTNYFSSGTIFYNIYSESINPLDASGYDLYIAKTGASLCATNPNGTFGNGITVVDSGVHIDYNNTNITMNDNGINLVNGDKSITLVPTGFDINGDTFEIKTTATATNTEIQINNGELSIQTSTDNGTNMWYNQNSIEGIMFEYQAMSGDSFIDNELHMDSTGLHFNTIEGDDCYLNYFMTTPNSSNPIATQADLNAIPTIDMHNDGVEITGDATLSSISNCIHTHNGTLNTIVATIEYTANSAITDNNTYITLDTEEFIIPPTFPVIAYDTTINNSIQLRWLGNNIWSLAGSEANHTYIITLFYSYIEGGNN